MFFEFTIEHTLFKSTWINSMELNRKPLCRFFRPKKISFQQLHVLIWFLKNEYFINKTNQYIFEIYVFLLNYSCQFWAVEWNFTISWSNSSDLKKEQFLPFQWFFTETVEDRRIQKKVLWLWWHHSTNSSFFSNFILFFSFCLRSERTLQIWIITIRNSVR